MEPRRICCVHRGEASPRPFELLGDWPAKSAWLISSAQLGRRGGGSCRHCAAMATTRSGSSLGICAEDKQTRGLVTAQEKQRGPVHQSMAWWGIGGGGGGVWGCGPPPAGPPTAFRGTRVFRALPHHPPPPPHHQVPATPQPSSHATCPQE